MDAVVIGSGPNGLAAAIVLARAGGAVTVHEAAAQLGGSARSAALTLPGFMHDVCSAVHPLAVSSPFFRTLPAGIEWVHPGAPLAHPLDDGTAVLLERSLDATCEALGADGAAWDALLQPFVGRWPELQEDLLAPLRWPRHPWLAARFGALATASASGLACRLFRGVRARALFAGLAAHSCLPLDRRPSAAFGLVLGIAAHAVGWPIPRGGAQRIASHLAACLVSLGGEVRTASRVERLPDVPLVLCDIGPRQLLALAGGRLPLAYRRRLERYRYGPGAYKVDWALDAPIPWTAAQVHGPGPCTWAARSKKSPPPSARRGRGG
jgi:phytoene dehydrogenase-like protein